MLQEKTNSGINSFSVFLSEFNKNGPTITIEYFTAPNSMAEFNQLKQQVNFSLMSLVKKEEIEMATNTSNITIVSNDSENEAPKSNPII